MSRRRRSPVRAALEDELAALLIQGGGGRAATERWSRGVEEQVREAFSGGGCPPGVVVFAQGGLARFDLTPRADVDLFVLVPEDEDGRDAAGPAVEAALRRLWDLDFSLGHVVRSASEAAEAVLTDDHAATALLEARPIAGDIDGGMEALQRLHREALAPRRKALLDEKVTELLERRQRFGASVHLVEPNVKSSPGGLRDLHSLQWIGLLSAPWRQADVGLGKPVLGHLLATGRITEREVALLGEAADTLLAVRVALHLEVGRREDRLLYEHQAAVAERIGVVGEDGETAAEALMRLYLQAALRTRTCVDEVVERMLEGPSLTRWYGDARVGAKAPVIGRRLEPGFRARGVHLFVDDPDLFERQPARVVDAFRLAAEHDLLPSPRTRTRMRVAIEGAGPLHEDREVGEALLRLCRSQQVVGRPFTAMLEAGVTGVVLRDLGRLAGRFKHDGYHAYTTDAHICRCADMALAVASGREPPAEPLLPSLRRTSRFHLFVLGALMHDLAKGLPGDHSSLGIEVARREAQRMGLPPGEAGVLAFLVENHLLLSRVSQRRDVSDPGVVEEVAEKVRTLERLDLLGLLTWVDIASVAPGMFTDWKGRLLGLLIERVAAFLSDPDAGSTLRGREDEEVRQNARAILRDHAPAAVVERFVQGASPRSLASRFERSLVRDLETYAAYIAAGEGAPVVLSRRTDGGRAHTLRVACQDRRRLLADLSSELSAQGANVLHAHADSRHDGIALHAFRIDDHASSALDPGTLSHIEAAVAKTAAASAPPRRPPRRRPRGGVRVPSQVRMVEGSDSWGAVIVDVRAEDRPGLMADVLSTLADHHFDVLLAKVNTEGHRARDSFYVLPEGGGPVPEGSLAALEAALLATLEGAQ